MIGGDGLAAAHGRGLTRAIGWRTGGGQRQSAGKNQHTHAITLPRIRGEF
jgi:hypothetical protein